jgi:hypothetical protein
VFYSKPKFVPSFHNESLTLSDLKKDEVLKLA